MHNEARGTDNFSLPCLFFLPSAGLFAVRLFPVCFPPRILGGVQVAEVAILPPSSMDNLSLAAHPELRFPHHTSTYCSLSQLLIAICHPSPANEKQGDEDREKKEVKVLGTARKST